MLIRHVNNAWYLTQDNGFTWTYIGNNARDLSSHLKVDRNDRMIDVLRKK